MEQGRSQRDAAQVWNRLVDDRQAVLAQSFSCMLPDAGKVGVLVLLPAPCLQWDIHLLVFQWVLHAGLRLGESTHEIV